MPLAAFAATFFWKGGLLPSGGAVTGFAGGDRETASFGLCDGPIRVTCVVDGDTFWYRGAKIRIADINAPELSEPECAAEAALARRATARLTELLNDGPFSLENIDRSEDRYGRKLKVVTRQGHSLGKALVNEGLAEDWKGYRGYWC